MSTKMNKAMKIESTRNIYGSSDGRPMSTDKTSSMRSSVNPRQNNTKK